MPAVEARGRTAAAAAALMVFATAFSLRDILLDLDWLTFSLPEMAAVAFFAAYLAWMAAGGAKPLFTRATAVLDLGVFSFVAVNFISAATAADRGSALQFAIRMLYLGSIYFGVSRLPLRARPQVMLPAALAAALAAVVLLGWLEEFLAAPARAWLFAPFQESATTFDAFYNLRVASTLGFPTVLSVYLDLALPLALVAGVRLAWHRRAWRRNVILVLTGLAGIAAMAVQLFTYTRSSLVVAPLSLLIGAIAGLYLGAGRRAAVSFGLAAALLVAALGASAVLNEKMAVRLGLAQEAPRYAARYQMLQLPGDLKPGGKYTAQVQLTNTGTATWGVKGSKTDEVSLSYRWLSYPGDGQQQVPYLVTYLPAAVAPGQGALLSATFLTPPQPGKYILEFDLVQPQWGWFSQAGVPALRTGLEFPAGGPAVGFAADNPQAGAPAPDASAAQASNADVPRSQLWRAALAAFRDSPLLGIGADQFRNRYADYLGFAADDRLSAHDMFLEAMANTGILGLLALLWVLIAAAARQLRLIANQLMNSADRLLALALFVALLAYIGHGLLDSFFWQTGVSFLFFSVLGLTAWLARNPSEHAKNA